MPAQVRGQEPKIECRAFEVDAALSVVVMPPPIFDLNRRVEQPNSRCDGAGW